MMGRTPRLDDVSRILGGFEQSLTDIRADQTKMLEEMEKLQEKKDDAHAEFYRRLNELEKWKATHEAIIEDVRRRTTRNIAILGLVVTAITIIVDVLFVLLVK